MILASDFPLYKLYLSSSSARQEGLEPPTIIQLTSCSALFEIISFAIKDIYMETNSYDAR